MGFSPAEWFYWLVVIGYALAFVGVAGYVIYSKFRKKPIPPSPPLYRTLNNGWVRVNREAFYFHPGEESRLLSELNYRVPWEVRRMLFPLLIGERAQLAKLDDPYPDIDPTQKEEWAANCKRGLTIGSAFFNYPIHPSMLLFDDKTRYAWELYQRGSKERKTVDEWRAEFQGTFENNYELATSFERSHNLQIDHFIEYYKRHEAFVEKLLLSRINQFSTIPSIDGLILSCIAQLKQDARNDATQHYFYCLVNVAVRLLDLSVPFEWIIHSELVDKATARIRREINATYAPIETNAARPQLSLVINNPSKDN